MLQGATEKQMFLVILPLNSLTTKFINKVDLKINKRDISWIQFQISDI